MTFDIKAWLHNLGLEQYSSAFEAHHIDLSLLCELNHDYLIDLGVDSLGHRLTLLKAIKNLAHSEAATSSQPLRVLDTEATTERRQLTVMFCDLVNSTDLANKVDAEDLRFLITAYQRAAEPVITHYGGHIAQYLGDGLLVYFGYPEAHEDDAIRAVHTGIDLIERIRELSAQLLESHHVSLAVRIGIHTGHVVIGQIGSIENSSLLATGSTPNIAAHLQQKARENSVIVSRETRLLLGDAFLLEAVGQSEFQVHGAQLVESRFAASGRRTLSLLVDRHAERSALQQLWKHAQSGSGHAVYLSGEAGIGKSRMVKVLCDDIANTDHHKIVYQCSPYHMDSPLYPTQRQLTRALRSDLPEGDTPSLDDLEALLDNVAIQLQHEAHLLADLVGLEADAEERYGEFNGTPQDKREQTLDTLVNQLFTLAKKRPVLIIFEDVQWSDATTLELARRAMDRISTSSVLMVLTSRSGEYPEWCQPPNAQLMPMKRLSENGIREIVNQLTGTTPLPDTWIDQIIDRSDGVPLYAEELTKALTQTPLPGSEHDSSETIASTSTHIPSSLHDSLIARLDKMRGIKPIAQMAACIGREFTQNDLAAFAPVTQAELALALEQLQNEDILESASTRHDGNYLFRHALLRDAAYESLPKTRRKALHSQYLDVLLERSDSSPDVMAHHAVEADRYHVAAQQYDIAGLSASSQAAFNEAIAHFERAVSCTHKMSDESLARRMELDARVHQGHASTGLNGFAHPDTVRCNAHARALLDQVGESPYKISVLYGHWVIQYASGKHHKALNDANQIHAVMHASDDRVKKMVGNRIRGSTRLMMGEFTDAKVDLQNTASLYDANDWQLLAAQFGMDMAAPTFTSLALIHVCHGHAEPALQLMDGLEARALEQAHPGTMLYTLSHLALVHQAGALPGRAHFVEAADELASRLAVASYRGHTLGIKAMFLLDNNDVEASVDIMAESLSIIESTKTYLYTPLLYGSYALALARQGKCEASNAAASSALELIRTGGERWSAAEVQRLCALSAALCGASNTQTLEALHDASSVARKQGAELWLLRIAVSRAEVLAADGKYFEAHSLLEDIVEKFPVSGRGLQNYQAACDLLTKVRTTQHH